MKKLIVYILCLLFLSCNNNTPDAMNCEEAHLWDYPLLQGTDEEKANACQIPANVLHCLSTEALTDLCLRYPLLENIFSFDLLDEGLDRLFVEFNGIRALFARADVASVLLKRYKEKISNLPFHENVFIFDALLSRVEGQDETLKEILRTLFTGYDAISGLEVDSELLLQYNFFSRAYVIIKISDEYLDEIPLGKTNPVFAPAGADSETAAIINQLSYQLCCNYEEAMAWEYPIKPGTSEWYRMDFNDRNIPEKFLYCLSTEKLTDLCMQIPFSYSVMTYEYLHGWINSYIQSYNGMRELFTRKDVVFWLLKLYNEEIPLYLWDYDPHPLPFSIQILGHPSVCVLEAFLEFAARQEEDVENLKEILRNLFLGYEAFHYAVNPTSDWGSAAHPNYFARAHVIIKICEQCLEEIPEELNNRVFRGNFLTIETAEIINKLSYQLIQ